MARIMLRKTLDNVMFELDNGWFAMVIKDEDFEDVISFYIKYDRCPWMYCRSEKVDIDYWYELANAEGDLMTFVDDAFYAYVDEFIEKNDLGEDIMEECKPVLEWEDF